MNLLPAPKPSFSINPGDIFLLGEHRLACGDAKDMSLVKTLIGGNKIDLVLTDPPYGIGYVESKEGIAEIKTNKVITNDHLQSNEEYRSFTKNWLAALVPCLGSKNSVYIFNSDKMIFPLREGMRDAGLKFTQLLIWVKNHSIIGRMDYLPQHELIAYGWHGTHAFRRSKDKSVLIHPKPQKSSLHPTMKPIGLLRNLILNSSKVGQVVFDPFGGSGSTLIASEQTKRRCYTIELDPEYCQTIITRFEKLSGQTATKYAYGGSNRIPSPA
jgi:DNA modification methylase